MESKLSRRKMMAQLGAAALGAKASGQSSSSSQFAHRMGSALLLFQAPEGRAVSPGRRAKITQTSSKFLFGCNLFRFEEMDSADLEKAYRDQFAAIFNYATIPVYWRMVEPARGKLSLERQDRMVRWCGEHSIAVKGHALAYNNRDPEWLPGDTSEVEKLLLAHIRDLMERYRQTVAFWDVVNEAVRCVENQEKRKSAPRLTAAIEKMGVPGYLRQCFAQARRADPAAHLAINEAALGDVFADDILSQLSPDSYDIIGMQAHQHDGAWTEEQIAKPCRRLARFGKHLHFTEVTLISGKPQSRKASDRERWDTTRDGEERQARDVERFYTSAFAQPDVKAITWWDFSDFQAWKGAPAGLLRADMSPKPSYGVLRRLIREKWSTHATTETGRGGTLAFEGYLGSYLVNVHDGERNYQGGFVLDGTNRTIGVPLACC